MDIAHKASVYVITVGLEKDVTRFPVMSDAQSMVNARMALVSALKDGMAGIAHWVSFCCLIQFLELFYQFITNLLDNLSSGQQMIKQGLKLT